MPDFTNSCKAIAGLIMLLAVIGTAFVFVQQCFAKVKEKQRAKTMRGDRTDSHSLSAAGGGGTWQRHTSDLAMFTGSGHALRSKDFKTEDHRNSTAIPLGETGFGQTAALQREHGVLNPTVNPMRKEQERDMIKSQDDLKTRAMRIYSAEIEQERDSAPGTAELPSIDKRAALAGGKLTQSHIERTQREFHL